MNRNVYLNFILTILLIVVSIIAFVLVRSIDLLRFQTEKVSEQLIRLENKINNLEKNHSNLPRFPSSDLGISKKDFKDIANYKFYDHNADEGGRLIAAISSETKNMNYLVNNEYFVSTIWDYAFDLLAERNYEHPEIFEPKLAESWELSEDKLTYTVRLKKGVLWHDFTDPVNGKKWTDVEVTAADFKFYVDVIKNEDVDCAPSRIFLQDLDRIEVLSDYEFKVYWKKPYFLSESITLTLSPLPRHLYHAYDGPFDGRRFNDDHERNRIVVGCGPYCFDRWEKGQRIILKRWEKYYGRNYGIMPPIKNIVFEVINHPNTQFQSLLSGAVDRMDLTPEQWINRTDIPEFDDKNGCIRKIKYPSMTYSYIGYNLKMPLFQDKKVRQALTHLVDRERILKEVYYGLGRITTGSFFIDTVYYDKSVIPYPFSVEKAKVLLKEAGWTDTNKDGILDKDGKNFEFTILSIANHPIQSRMLPIIKEDMAKAGIIMKIASVEWSVYVQRLENKSFEVCTLAWAMSFEGDPYQLWHSSQADMPSSSNHIGFKNAAADELIEKIRVCFDIKERIELCHKFHRLLHEEQPYTFLFTRDDLVAQHKRYRNVRIFPGGTPVKIMWEPSAEQVRIKE